LVVLPTYNERENLEAVVGAVLGYGFDVLVIDDNSADGTGQLADQLASSDRRVDVLHRSRKLGLGSAYIVGFQRGLEQGYRFILEMDADGSHQASELHRLLAAAKQSNGVAIGSRYVRGGGSIGWSLQRRILSRAANSYCRALLGRRLHDWTSGYRCYSASVFRDVGPQTL